MTREKVTLGRREIDALVAYLEPSHPRAGAAGRPVPSKDGVIGSNPARTALS